MRLLVTVTVLYLVTSSVYSKMMYPPRPNPTTTVHSCDPYQCASIDYCPTNLVKDRSGCCNVCAKEAGESCQGYEQCARGLECSSYSTCQSGKGQYFWLVRFGPNVVQIRLILDKFVVFRNRTKM